jgi:hypothetical protein
MNWSEPDVTYSKSKVVGLSVADAIGVICAGVTDANRWASFRNRINLSDRQTVHIGGEYGGGAVNIWVSEPPKTQFDIDVEAYAAALRPMVDDLAAGKLVVECRAIVSAGGSPSFLFEADRWEDGWKLIVDGKSAILVDEEGTKYKLLSFQVANVQPPGAAAEVVSALAIQAEADPKLCPPARKNAGAPGKYEWDALQAALISDCFLDYSFPLKGGEQAKIEAWALDWLKKKDSDVKSGQEPGISTIRRHVKSAITAYGTAAIKLPEKDFPVGS